MPILTCWERQDNINFDEKSLKLLIDFGGTNFRYLIKNSKEILESKTIDSKDLSLYDFLVEMLTRYRNIDFVGISYAGQVKDNIIVSSPNINIQNMDIKKEIESQFDVLVLIDNDLKTALLAEVEDIGVDDSLTLFYIGTGIGSASCEKGTIIRGTNNFAGEIGHIPFKNAPFQCGCGKYDCGELFASGSALKRWIEYYQIPVEEPTLEALDLLDTAQAKEVYKNFHEALLHAASTLVTLLNPKHLILGGGVFKNNPNLVEFLKDG